MINVNKLFPRLSIRVKLIIAFALVALGPLVVVSYLGARETVIQIKARAYSALEHDLEMAEARTTQTLSSAENLVEIMTKLALGPPGHVPIPANSAQSVITLKGKALLDSGNASFRASKHAEALAFYRRATTEMPGHAAPWFGAYMVARALNDTVLADSAMRMVRTRAPGMQEHPARSPAPMTPASPHGATIPKAGGTF